MEYNFIRKRRMDMSQQYFEEEVKHKIVKLHLEGRTLKSLAEEYGVSKASISNWVKQYRNECQTNQELQEESDYLIQNKRLKRELEEAKKEVAFLKKAAAFFAKEID